MAISSSQTSLSKLHPVQQFIGAVGKDVIKYFGKDDACIVYLQPHGVFYAIALYDWLKKKKKNVTLTTMQDDGTGLEESKVKGRKVLIVNNDIITGKAYKRSTEAMREREEKLHIKDIKSAVLLDRVGLADFSALEYSSGTLWRAGGLDGIDLKIITMLGENGRESFAAIGKELKLSAVAVKSRVDRLIKDNVLKIQGMLEAGRFYNMSASIRIEADRKATETIIAKFKKLVGVYCLVREAGDHNLLVRIFAQSLNEVNELVDNELRTVPGVHRIGIQIGELPILPQTIAPKVELSLPRVKDS